MQHDPLEPKSISKCARGCQWIKESISVRNVISVEAISCAECDRLEIDHLLRNRFPNLCSLSPFCQLPRPALNSY